MLERKEAAAARNREQFPTAARFVDDMREVFGPDVKLVWAQENGREVGVRGPDGVPPTIERRIDLNSTTNGKR